MARAAWRAELRGIDPRQLVFLDETHTPTTLTPLWGRSRRGQRVVGRVARGRWHTVSLLATLTSVGFGPGLQVDGTVDRAIFDQFVTEVLVPSLRPGQIVVLDNLSVHKRATTRQAIEAAGCTLRFLPTYSPDFNPIELAFSKLKHLLRQAEARTVETVFAATQAAYPRITSTDALSYYRAAGYSL